MRKLLSIVALFFVLAPAASSDVPDLTAEFVFARVQFNMNWEAVFQREAPWHHDYPYSEHFYLGVVRELTTVHTSDEAYQIVRLDSPDIFRFPFLYLSEPGFMSLTEDERDNLRDYLDRGGFLMFDDFRGRDLANLQFQMKQVYPDREMFRLDLSHPIWNSFYAIDSIEMAPPYFDERFTGNAEFWGMTDEHGRLIMIANQNNDFGEYWEWLDQGDQPLQPSAQSVRFGINYLIYAMTH